MKSGEEDSIERPRGNPAPDPQFGSDVIAETLRALDLRYIALNPGASFRGLHDSLVNFLGNRDPQLLLCLHEEHAVAIAHGYAKVTGRAIGVAVHSNVGLFHATMAIFNAWCDRMPVVILGATGPVDAAKRRPWIDWIHTARDQGAIVRGYVKWDDQPASPAAAREALLRAAAIAHTAPAGPVYVNLDAELQEAPLSAPLPPITFSRYASPMPDAASADGVRRAAALLAAAEQPLDPDRSRIARRGCMGRPRRAGGTAGRGRGHRSQGRRGVSDRSSAARRRAGNPAAARTGGGDQRTPM